MHTFKNHIFHPVLIFCSANPVSWQCQFLTQGSKLDLETSIQFSVEPPNDFIDENAIDDNDEEEDSQAMIYHQIVATAVTRQKI